MKILSVNIRGLGTSDKIDWIREMCIKEKPGILGIQESKMRRLSENEVAVFWGSDDFKFAKVDALGRSGGIVTVWDINVFNENLIMSEKGFLLVKGGVEGD